MSSIINGVYVEKFITRNAKGGTELMRDRFLSSIDKNLLQGVVIHFSRIDEIDTSLIQILYLHDLPDDPMYNNVFKNGVYEKIDMFVFVSHHQKDLFIQKFNIPYSKVRVIPNAIGDYHNKFSEKSLDGPIRFVYHTTPHRGLELLYPAFVELSKNYNVTLDVFSSFKVYGWGDRDKQYENLFDKLKTHDKITYHGAQSNDVVLDYLKKSHVFLYPCIWHETSCLALMEAIQNGCICIHPDYGALPETAKGNTFMFPMSDDVNVIATNAYNYSKYMMDNINHVIEMHNAKTSNFYPYSINDYVYSWNNLIGELKHGRNLRVSKK